MTPLQFLSTASTSELLGPEQGDTTKTRPRSMCALNPNRIFFDPLPYPKPTCACMIDWTPWGVLRLMSTRLFYIVWRTVHSSRPVWLVCPGRYSFHGITWHWITGMTLTRWFGVTLTQITIKRSSGFRTTSGSPLTLELSHVCSWFGSDLSVFQQHYYLCCVSP